MALLLKWFGFQSSYMTGIPDCVLTSEQQKCTSIFGTQMWTGPLGKGELLWGGTTPLIKEDRNYFFILLDFFHTESLF